MAVFTSSTVILTSLLAGLLVFAVISNVVARNPLAILLRRVVLACAIFGLSFTVFRYIDAEGPFQGDPFFSTAVLVVTVVLSVIERKARWGFVFGYAWSIGMLGTLSSTPEVGTAGSIILVAIMAGILLAAFCAGIASLSGWLGLKLSLKRQHLKEHYEREKAEIVSMIDEALNEKGR